MKNYIVAVVYRGQTNFAVQASSKEEAQEKARAMYRAGMHRTPLGNEWEEVDRLGEPEEVPS